MSIIRPMLAGRIEDARVDIDYPVIASPKLDGIRCLILPCGNGRIAVSRNMKAIPNSFVQNWLSKNCPVGLDGELMVRSGEKDVEFSQVTSGIMNGSGEPDFYYALFDYIPDYSSLKQPFTKRLNNMGKALRDAKLADGFTTDNATYIATHKHIKIVPQRTMRTYVDLMSQFDEWLAEGYEGAMVRKPDSPYKYGRSTLREGWLLKLKPWDSAEAEIVGFNALLHNKNAAGTDAFGLTERSQEKAGMVASNDLGSFDVIDVKTHKQFSVGSGFTAAQRHEYWRTRTDLLGKIIQYKYGETVKESTGVPRFPIFLGFRDRGDMSEE